MISIIACVSVLFGCLLQPTACQNAISLEVEHKATGADYTSRGTVIINAQGSADPQFKSISSWHAQDQLAAVRSNSLYCVRTKAQPFNHQSNQYVFGCMPSCLMVLSDLTDLLTLTMDPSRQYVIGLSVQVQQMFSPNLQKSCQNLELTSIAKDEFNTTVRFMEPVEGPVPETQAYLQKLEREKQEKAQGEQGDNRSFIAKYWMYIVPVVVIVMLSGAMSPEAQQQGR